MAAAANPSWSLGEDAPIASEGEEDDEEPPATPLRPTEDEDGTEGADTDVMLDGVLLGGGAAVNNNNNYRSREAADSRMTDVPNIYVESKKEDGGDESKKEDGLASEEPESSHILASLGEGVEEQDVSPSNEDREDREDVSPDASSPPS